MNLHSHKLGDRISIPFDEVTVGRSTRSKLSAGERQHAGVNVDPYDVSGHTCERHGKEAVATAEIDYFQARWNSKRSENLFRFRPQCLPPIRIRHRRGCEETRKARIIHNRRLEQPD